MLGAFEIASVELRGETRKGVDKLDAAFLARTAAVVWDWRDFFNQFDVQTSRLEGRDRTFATAARALHSDFNVTHAKLSRLFGSLLSGTLASERRAFAASLEATGPGTGPAKRIAFRVSNRHCRVVERRVNVSNAIADVTTDAFLFVGLSHRRVSGKLE